MNELVEAVEIRELIELFKVWVKGKLHYTGRTRNANKMAKVLPLFRGFVSAHAKYFDEHYSYKHRGTGPGQLAKIYPVFRDRIVLVALCEIRVEFMESMGHTDELEPVCYVFKNTTRANGDATPRAILGWETV